MARGDNGRNRRGSIIELSASGRVVAAAEHDAPPGSRRVVTSLPEGNEVPLRVPVHGCRVTPGHDDLELMAAG